MKFISTILLLLLLATPVYVGAQATSTASSTQAQIDSLIDQVRRLIEVVTQLQRQLTQLRSQAGSSNPYGTQGSSFGSGSGGSTLGGGSGGSGFGIGNFGNLSFDAIVASILAQFSGQAPSGPVSGESQINQQEPNYSQQSDFQNLPPLVSGNLFTGDQFAASKGVQMALRDSGKKSSSGNPILILGLIKDGQVKQVYAVSGTPTGWTRDRNTSGSLAPLPNGTYLVGKPGPSTISKLPASERVSIRLTPTFTTGRTDIMIHRVLNQGVPSTAGCIGVASWPDMQEVIKFVNDYYASSKEPLKLNVLIGNNTPPQLNAGSNTTSGFGQTTKPTKYVYSPSEFSCSNCGPMISGLTTQGYNVVEIKVSNDEASRLGITGYPHVVDSRL